MPFIYLCKSLKIKSNIDEQGYQLMTLGKGPQKSVVFEHSTTQQYT